VRREFLFHKSCYHCVSLCYLSTMQTLPVWSGECLKRGAPLRDCRTTSESTLIVAHSREASDIFARASPTRLLWDASANMGRKLLVPLQLELLSISAKDVPVGVPEGLNRQPHSERPKPRKRSHRSIPSSGSRPPRSLRDDEYRIAEKKRTVSIRH